LQNVLIAGCTVYEGHGGFVIGSNTDGGMRNIFVSDCSFIGTETGIRVKSNAGRGGVVKNVYICNISMTNIQKEAIVFDTYYEDVPAGKQVDTVREIRDKTPMFSDFHISNITCKGAKNAIRISGLPEMPISRLFFDGVTIESEKGAAITDASNLDFKNITIITPASSVFSLSNTKGFTVTGGVVASGTQTFVTYDKKSNGVNISNTDFKGNKKAVIQL